MLASLKTTAAFFPPSSSETFFREAAVSWAILWPTWVEPDKKYQQVSLSVWELSFHNANLPTSEGDDLDFWVSDDALSYRAAVAKHHVDHPGGEPRLHHQGAEHPGRDAGHLAGLAHHRVPRHDGRGDLEDVIRYIRFQ